MAWKVLNLEVDKLWQEIGNQRPEGSSQGIGMKNGV